MADPQLEYWQEDARRLNRMANLARVDGLCIELLEEDGTNNAFCKTGIGGGVDDSCGRSSGTPKSLEDLQRKYSGVILHIEEGKNVVLHHIQIPESMRGKGVGSRVMTDLARYADKAEKPLLLMPDENFGTSKDDLDKFYKSFGFKRVKSKDWTSGWMRRESTSGSKRTNNVLTTNEPTGDGHWITLKGGHHIFVKQGESVGDVISKFRSAKGSTGAQQQKKAKRLEDSKPDTSQAAQASHAAAQATHQATQHDHGNLPHGGHEHTHSPAEQLEHEGHQHEALIETIQEIGGEHGHAASAHHVVDHLDKVADHVGGAIDQSAGHGGHLDKLFSMNKLLGAGGKVAATALITGMAVRAIKKYGGSVGAKVGQIEHVVGEFTKNNIGKAVAGLAKHSPAMAQGVLHTFTALRLAKNGLFAIYHGAQATAEKVALERGWDEKAAMKFKGTLANIDYAIFSPFKVAALSGVHAAHLPAYITGLIPMGTMGYLAYAGGHDAYKTVQAAAKAIAAVGTAKLGKGFGGEVGKAVKQLREESQASLAKGTTKAAVAGVKSGVAGVKSVVGKIKNKLRRSSVTHNQLFELLITNAEGGIMSEDDANKIADAMEAHNHEDWYSALLHTAVDQLVAAGTADESIVAGAIALADEAYEKHPAPNSTGEDQEETDQDFTKEGEDE